MAEKSVTPPVKQQAAPPARSEPIQAGAQFDSLLALQRAAGNRAVGVLLAGAAAPSPNSGNEAPPSVQQTLQSGGGQPLDADTRRSMETSFGEDFSQVRVHTDPQAANSAKEAGAKAYTSGSQIVFGAGQYQPHTPSGKRLLAHELAHVQQQRGTTPASSPSGKLTIAPRNHPLERQAERAAAQIASGRQPASRPAGAKLERSSPQVSSQAQAVFLYPDVEADMLESDKKRVFKDPKSGVQRNVYDAAKGGYAKNPSATELSTIVKNGKVTGGFDNGKFMYVVDENGKIIVGKRMGEAMPHPTLIGGQNPKVQAAGMVEIQGGKIVHIDNHSGHYKPPKPSLKHAVKSFMKLDERVFKDLKVWSIHFDKGKEKLKRFRSVRLLKLKKFDISRVMKKFRWTSIKGNMRSRGFKAGAKGIAALLAILIVDWLLSKYLDEMYREMEEKQIKRDIEKEEPKVRATLEKALEAKMDELDALLEANPDAKIYVNVRYRFGRLSVMETGDPYGYGGGMTDTHVVELQFVDAGFSNAPWPETGGYDFETMGCGTSMIEWTPVTFSEEIPIKELLGFEEEAGAEEKELEKEPAGAGK